MSGFVCSPGDSFMPGLRCFFVFSLVPLLSAIAFATDANHESTLLLRQNWFIQSSENLHSDGAAIINCRLFVQRLVSGNASFHRPECAG